jgi:hypothetical protein
MKKIILLSLLITLFFIAGCKKDATNSNANTTRLIGGLKTTSNGAVVDTIAYTYDSSNRIVEVVENSNGTLLDTKLAYDSGDRVIEANLYTNSQLTNKSTFTYGNGTAMQQSIIYSNGNTTTTNFTLTLNSAQHIIKKAVDANNYTNYTYDASGNVTTITQYTALAGTTPYSIFTATYDNHDSIYLNIKGNYYIWFDRYAPYNIVTQNSIINNGTLVINILYSFAGTFNSSGYLTSRVVTSSGTSSGQTNTTFTYINK